MFLVCYIWLACSDVHTLWPSQSPRAAVHHHYLLSDRRTKCDLHRPVPRKEINP